MLEVRHLGVRYGPIPAVRDISFDCAAGEIVALIGPNGAGKSSTLAALSAGCFDGTVAGEVTFDGDRVLGSSPEKLVHRGLALVPEGRRIFTTLTVEENLQLGRSSGRTADFATELERVFARFPILREFRHRSAGLLSGGQQQMLAIGRALVTAPRLLLLDEPSLGLGPKVVEEVFEQLGELRAEGLAIVLVEQNALRATELADNTLVIRQGAVEGVGTEMVNDELIDAYFGPVKARRR